MLGEIENAGRVVGQGEAILSVDDIILCQDLSSVRGSFLISGVVLLIFFVAATAEGSPTTILQRSLRVFSWF